MNDNPDIDSDIEYMNLNDITTDLHDCYQIQVDDDGICKPVLLGKYESIPLPINKVFRLKKYLLHLVTYVLTKEETDNGLWKIVGVNVVRQNRKKSLCALDFVWSPAVEKYQLIFSDHVNNTSKVVETLDKFPGKDKLLEYVIEKSLDDPIRSIVKPRTKTGSK